MTTPRTTARERDLGMTVVEMAVVMLILGIVIAATATLTIGFQRTNAENVARQDQLDSARSSVERISRMLRSAVKPSQLLYNCPGCLADAFMSAGDVSVRFYANVDNPGNTIGPSRVTYAVPVTGVDRGVLIETVQVPDPGGPLSTGYVYCDATATGASEACKSRLTTRRLAEGVSTAEPIFAYYGPDGARLNTGGAGLSGDDLAKVLSVELVLTVESTEPTKPLPTTYIQRITLPNAQAVIRQDEEDE